MDSSMGIAYNSNSFIDNSEQRKYPPSKVEEKPPLKEKITIFVQLKLSPEVVNKQPTIITLQLPPLTTVKQLWENIKNKQMCISLSLYHRAKDINLSFPIEHNVLKFKNDKATLNELGIENGDTIYASGYY